MISTRPSHISTVQIQVERSLNGAKEPYGPAKPNAGPTLPRQAAAAPKASKRVEVLAGAAGVGHQPERADRERQQVEQDEDDRRAQRLLVHDAAVDADRHDHLAVNGLLELALDELEQQQVADDLDPAAGRARGGAGEHQQQQRDRRQRPPERVVGGREAGRGEDRRGLEEAVADARLAALVAAADDLDRDQDRADARSARGTAAAPRRLASTAKRRCTKKRYSRRKLIPAMIMKTSSTYCVIGRERGDRDGARAEAAERDDATAPGRPRRTASARRRGPSR